MGGLISSLYCPVFTLHKKATKNRAATDILANKRIIITLIVGGVVILVKVNATS
jgi:hypothetical protein